MGMEEGGGFRMGNTGIPVADSFDIWQNQQNIVKFKNKIKFKKKKNSKRERDEEKKNIYIYYEKRSRA